MTAIAPAQLFKSLSDETRLRCLALLVQHGELCVCELTHALELPQPKISHHLANLRKSGLVIDRKNGLWIYYRLHPDLATWVTEILKISVNNIKHTAPFYDDDVRLMQMPDRPANLCSA